MTAPTLEALTTVAGAAILTTVLMEFLVLRLLNLTPAQKDRFGPLLAVGVGVVVVLVAVFTVIEGPARADVVQGVINGIFAGLSAIGLHDVATSAAPE